MTATSAPFGNLPRTARRQAGMTQLALAERADLSVRSIEHLEASQTVMWPPRRVSGARLDTERRGARTLLNWFRLGARIPDVSLRPVDVNGGPGALLLDAHQRLIGVIALQIEGGLIQSISSIVNPDKLAHLGPVGDMASLLGSQSPS